MSARHAESVTGPAADGHGARELSRYCRRAGCDSRDGGDEAATRTFQIRRRRHGEQEQTRGNRNAQTGLLDYLEDEDGAKRQEQPEPGRQAGSGQDELNLLK